MPTISTIKSAGSTCAVCIALKVSYHGSFTARGTRRRLEAVTGRGVVDTVNAIATFAVVLTLGSEASWITDAVIYVSPRAANGALITGTKIPLALLRVTLTLTVAVTNLILMAPW